MSMKPERSMNYSWTQPYLPTSYIVAGVNAVTEEMIRIAAVDNIIESMTSYPDAERIINKIIGDMK